MAARLIGAPVQVYGRRPHVRDLKLRDTSSTRAQASHVSNSLLAELAQQPDSVRAVFGQKQPQPILVGSNSEPTTISLDVECFDRLLVAEPEELRQALRLAHKYQLSAFLINADHLLTFRADSERYFWTSSADDLCRWTGLLHELGFTKAIPACTAAFFASTPKSITAAEHLAASRKAAYLGPLPAGSLLPILCEFFDNWRKTDLKWSSFTSSIDRDQHLQQNPIRVPGLGIKDDPESIRTLLPGYDSELWSHFSKAASDEWPKRQVTAAEVGRWAEEARAFAKACDDITGGHKKT
ncbi:hypothetical protein WJX73_001158 [Symbiochloris irregularis]|uniref:Uncharacterized protein n=1 Tax=Symbiochloris irregularis TaxID=706552 RepID=A0AAW1NQ95_9CHLO